MRLAWNRAASSPRREVTNVWVWSQKLRYLATWVSKTSELVSASGLMISCNITDLPIGKADAELLTRRRVQKTDDIVTARGREDGETLSREAQGFGERFEVGGKNVQRWEEHTSELQSLMRISS